MKSLQDYMNDRQTALFNETGSFFAFSEKQYQEARKEGVTYVSLDAGLICPKETAQKLIDGLEQIYQESIQQDIAENGAEAIIKRELHNHECFYTGSFSDAKNRLSAYNFPKELWVKVWREEWRTYAESDN